MPVDFYHLAIEIKTTFFFSWEHTLFFQFRTCGLTDLQDLPKAGVKVQEVENKSVRFLWGDWLRVVLGYSFSTTCPTTLSLSDQWDVNIGMVGSCSHEAKRGPSFGGKFRVQQGEVRVLQRTLAIIWWLHILSWLSYVKMQPDLLYILNELNFGI